MKSGIKLIRGTALASTHGGTSAARPCLSSLGGRHPVVPKPDKGAEHQHPVAVGGAPDRPTLPSPGYPMMQGRRAGARRGDNALSRVGETEVTHRPRRRVGGLSPHPTHAEIFRGGDPERRCRQPVTLYLARGAWLAWMLR